MGGILKAVARSFHLRLAKGIETMTKSNDGGWVHFRMHERGDDMVNKRAGIALGCVLAVVAGCNRAETYFARGNNKSHQGDYDGAICDYKEASRLEDNKNSDILETHLPQGHSKHQIELFDGTILDFKNNDIQVAYIARGRSKLQRKDYEGAILDFEEAIKATPHGINSSESKRCLREARQALQEQRLE